MEENKSVEQRLEALEQKLDFLIQRELERTPIEKKANVEAVRPQEKAPVQTRIPSPVQAPVQTRIPSPVQAPVQTPMHTPVQTPMQVPMQTPMHTPVQTRMQVPVQTPTQAPVQAPIPAYSQVPTHKPVKGSEKEGLEFRIGAGLLSVIGVLFVLVAFITFGLNFLSGALQGIFLYIISIVILVASELFLAKKREKFSQGITGLGICSLYVSTILNYLYLNTINSLTAIILTLFIAGVAFYISKRKESGAIRIISIIGCYICFFPVRGFASSLDFLTITIILLLVNLICLFVPVRKMEQTIHYVHMICNIIFTYMLIGEAWNSNIEGGIVLLFLITALIVQTLIFMKQTKTTAAYVVYGVTLAVLSISTIAITLQMNSVFLSLVLTFSVTLFFFLYMNGKKEKWTQYYYFVLTALACVMATGTEPIPEAIVFLLAFAVVKMTAKVKECEWLNCIVTVLAVMVGLAYINEWYSWLFFAAFVLSVFRLHHFAAFHKVCLTLFVYLFLLLKLQWEIAMPAAMGCLVLLAFIVARLPKYRLQRERNPHNGYFYFNFTLMALLYLCLPFFNRGEAQMWLFVPSTAFCNASMLLLGLLVCVFFLKQEYGIRFKSNNIPLSVFLTYMIFVIDFKIPVIMSILLMIVAVGSVSVGFIKNEKAVRLYGLILSLFVCAKIVVYDFYALASLQRMLLFFVVGVIALAISFLYLYLEKSLKRNAQQKNENQEKIDAFHNM